MYIHVDVDAIWRQTKVWNDNMQLRNMRETLTMKDETITQQFQNRKWRQLEQAR